jgi:ubiquinone/menaquinone biosynthesis C-methylase UbiE
MSDDPRCPTSAAACEEVRALYTELALRPDQDFGWGKGKDNARRLGYLPEWLERLPDVVWESAAAVGNPFGAGALTAGETVVDIGCGAGADACIAAQLVGATGKVYGFDATPAMVTKARANARAAGLPQVEIRAGDMARLDLPDAGVDRVISNGAINLAPDKSRVFAEIFRILRPGGRCQFADMVRDSASAPPGTDGESWADCVSGTLAEAELRKLLSEAGFVDVERVGFTAYRTAPTTVGAVFRARKPAAADVSRD